MSESDNKSKLGSVKNIDSLSKNNQIKVKVEQKDISEAQALMQIAENNSEIFRTDNGEIYATIKVFDVIENVSVNDDRFKRMLRMKFYEIFEKPINSALIKDVLETIIANAEFNYTTSQETHVRVAKSDKGTTFYIDLANIDRQIVEIDANGWRILDEAPIKFKRPSTIEALPIPEQNNNIQILDKYLNIKDEDKILLYSFLVSCLVPNSPYPILILQGLQGSGKSFLSKLIKSIVDPTFAPIRSLPTTEENLLISANRTRLLAFDNISKLSNRMSDALCKLSTGGGFTTRKLYKNNDESVISTTRPTILNGIDYIARRPDLADRSIILNLIHIKGKYREPEEKLIKEIEIIKPKVLGALLTAISQGIKNFDKVQLSNTPRMADFTKWAIATETSLGYENGDFLQAYNRNRKEATIESVEHDLIISTIIKCLDDRKKISGNATEILSILENYVPKQYRQHENWIKHPNQLKIQIDRIRPILEIFNITYKYNTKNVIRLHTLEKIGDFPEHQL